MVDIRDNFFLYNQLFNRQSFDWLTVLALFLMGLFYLLPQLTGHGLSGRARGCFLGAVWVLVFKLFVHLVQVLLLNIDLFNMSVGGGRGGGMSLSAVVGLFFPILEGMFFILAVVLFVAGLPGMIPARDQRWAPEPRREEEEPGR